MSEPLKNRIAVVTGAAGTMGLATVQALLEDGCKVALVDVNAQRTKQLAQELGPRTQAFSFDISDPVDVNFSVKFYDKIVNVPSGGDSGAITIAVQAK